VYHNETKKEDKPKTPEKKPDKPKKPETPKKNDTVKEQPKTPEKPKEPETPKNDTKKEEPKEPEETPCDDGSVMCWINNTIHTIDKWFTDQLNKIYYWIGWDKETDKSEAHVSKLEANTERAEYEVERELERAQNAQHHE